MRLAPEQASGPIPPRSEGEPSVRAASVSDFRELARRRLPHIFFEYIDGGSYGEVTLRRNVADLEAIALRQRVMRDMSTLDMSVTSLGQTFSMPIGLAPVGMAGMYARRGETQAARAAKAAGVPFCLSAMGVCDASEVTAAAETPPWFQLYMVKDRGFMKALLERVKALGCPVLMFTVDLPLPGSRYRDIRSGFTGGQGLSMAVGQAVDGLMHPDWMWDVLAKGRPHTLGSIEARKSISSRRAPSKRGASGHACMHDAPQRVVGPLKYACDVHAARAHAADQVGASMSVHGLHAFTSHVDFQ